MQQFSMMQYKFREKCVMKFKFMCQRSKNFTELQKQGYAVAICRSWVAAKNLIENYLKNEMEKAA